MLPLLTVGDGYTWGSLHYSLYLCARLKLENLYYKRFLKRYNSKEREKKRGFPSGSPYRLQSPLAQARISRDGVNQALCSGGQQQQPLWRTAGAEVQGTAAVSAVQALTRGPRVSGMRWSPAMCHSLSRYSLWQLAGLFVQNSLPGRKSSITHGLGPGSGCPVSILLPRGCQGVIPHLPSAWP